MLQNSTNFYKILIYFILFKDEDNLNQPSTSGQAQKRINATSKSRRGM